MIQGLGPHASTAKGQGARVQSLVRELRCHTLLGVAKKNNTIGDTMDAMEWHEQGGE